MIPGHITDALLSSEFLEKLDAAPSKTVDGWRLLGEAHPDDDFGIGLTGDDIAEHCDAILAGRCVEAQAAGRSPSDHGEFN